MSAEELAKLAQNPVGNLISLPFQNNTNLRFGPEKGTQNILNIQPVIPIEINKDWNIITRTIVPVIWNPSLGPGDSATTGTGDTTFAAFLLPANPGKLIWGAGGLYAPGRLMFDADSNLWSGVNWMPGSQSNVAKNIGGGVAKFGPDGSALSPPVTGFMGAGINGVGWGTAVTRDNVWISSFNGKILVMDLQGRPVASEQDFPFQREAVRPHGHRRGGERRCMDRRQRGQSTALLPGRPRERGAHRQSRRPRGAVRCRHR